MHPRSQRHRRPRRRWQPEQLRHIPDPQPMQRHERLPPFPPQTHQLCIRARGKGGTHLASSGRKRHRPFSAASRRPMRASRRGGRGGRGGAGLGARISWRRRTRSSYSALARAFEVVVLSWRWTNSGVNGRALVNLTCVAGALVDEEGSSWIATSGSIARWYSEVVMGVKVEFLYSLCKQV